MTEEVKYDKHYRDDPAACGPPFAEFKAFCTTAEIGSVLDLGCGQGRDALLFARAGHRVVGVDVSSVGIGQLREIAKAENLDVEGIVADISHYKPDQRFDIVILDRVLHMLPTEVRVPVFEMAMDALSPGGHLLVAEGPKGMEPLRNTVQKANWALLMVKSNRLIAERPRP